MAISPPRMASKARPNEPSCRWLKRRLSDGRYSSVVRLKAAGQWGIAAVQALFESTYIAGLRKAGMPEE